MDTDKFKQDPVKFLIKKMINRGVGKCQKDDSARSYVITKIPQFCESMRNLELLKTIAAERFAEEVKKEEILRVFNTSINSAKFNKDLNEALEKFELNSSQAENNLRLVLQVYSLAKEQKSYERTDLYSEGAYE